MRWSWYARSSPAAPTPFDVPLPDLARAGGGPGFGFGGQTVQQPLDLLAKMFQSVAVQVGRDEDFAADHGPGARVRTRNGELVPGASHPPRAIVSEAHHHQRQAEFRGQVDAAGGQPPARAARAVGRDRQVHVAALGQQLAHRRHAAAIGRAAHELETQVMRRVGEDFRVAVTAQQHRQVAVPAQIQRKKDVFVPEDVDFLPAAFGKDRVDRRIVVDDLVVERAHPPPHGRRAQQAAEFVQKGAFDLHGEQWAVGQWSSGQCECRKRSARINDLQLIISSFTLHLHSPQNTSTASPVM